MGLLMLNSHEATGRSRDGNSVPSACRSDSLSKSPAARALRKRYHSSPPKDTFKAVEGMLQAR